MADHDYRADGEEEEYKRREDEEQTSNDIECGIQSGPNVGYGGKDVPFGDETNNEVKYRTMAWWQAGMIMIAETISLGILSLPSVLATVGIVPGVILIAGLGVLATYTGFVIGQFKLQYPHVHSMADAGEVMLGAVGREFFGAAQMLLLIFAMGSHILTFSIMLNTLSGHGTCSIVFGLCGLVVCFSFCLPRTLRSVSYMSIAAFISIVAAVLITMIWLGIERPGDQTVDATVHPDFATGFLATSNIVFAYAGHLTFFSFISELKDPKTYPKALFLLQGVDTSMYLIVAIVIYRYAGTGVKSPALSSASPVWQKAAYGVAIPTLVLAGVIYGHVAAKYIYVRLYRGTDRMSKRTWSSFGLWAIIVVVVWTIAWIVAEAIPVFNNLLGLIAALFASWGTYGVSGVFWLYLNRGQYRKNATKMFLTALNLLIVCIGAAICGLGLYASGTAIHSDSKKSNGGSFTCADNSKAQS